MSLVVLRTSYDAIAWRDGCRTLVALVPTMGYLHVGHQRLIEAARERVGTAGAVVVTIFVNPAQFDRREDLDGYPRDEAGDLVKAEAAGADVVFVPRGPTELYAGDAKTWVNTEDLDARLCGATRPGHFRGVCTVITKFCGILRPSVSLYGEKDYQQLAIIRRLHRDLFLPGDVVGVATVREPDGLAMSSRNARLDSVARAQARAIPRYLEAVRERLAAGQVERGDLLDDYSGALAPGRVDYVDLVDAHTLAAVDRIDRPAVCALAVFYGEVRLIDNVVLEPPH